MARRDVMHVCPHCGRYLQPIAEEDTIGGRIRAARQRQNLSLADVAERMGGWDRTRLAYYERNDHEPRYTTLAKIAQALGVDPVWLAFGDDRTEP